MALNVDGRDANLKGRYLVSFGESFGVSPAATQRMLRQLVTRAEPWIDRISEIGFDAKKMAAPQNLVRERRVQLAEGFDAVS